MASDIWALGMLLFEIFALEVPLSEAQCRDDLFEHNRRRAHLQSTQSASDEASESSESTTNPIAPSPGPVGIRYGREYLIERLTDSDEPLRPPTRGGAQSRENPHGMDVPEPLAPLLDKCWHRDPLRRPQVRIFTEFCLI